MTCQEVFIVNNGRAVQTRKPSSEKTIPSRPEFADWFSSIFQSLKMHCRIFCNLAKNSNLKTKQEIRIFKNKKNYTHVAFQVQVFRRKPKKLRLFSHNKKLKTLTQVKENNVVVNCIYDQILSENIYKNINHRTQLLNVHVTGQIHNL